MITSSIPDSSHAIRDLGSVQNRLAVCQKRRRMYLRRSSSTSSPSSSSARASISLSIASVFAASAASASAFSASVGLDSSISTAAVSTSAGADVVTFGALPVVDMPSAFLALSVSTSPSALCRELWPPLVVLDGRLLIVVLVRFLKTKQLLPWLGEQSHSPSL